MTEIQRLPEWKTMYDKYKDLDYNSIITYEELDACLMGGTIKENKRFVFEKFKKLMLRQENKALENIQKKGYRIVNPNEHARLTNREIKRAERRARMACDIILHTDMDKLTDRERLIAIETATRVQPLLTNLISEQKAIKEIKKYSLPQIPRA